MTKETSKNLKSRPPIVVVMGHIDHGKTTLLDFIRKTNVAPKEAGGITQSIGAYEIEHNGRKITFIDTPGHEAFIKMRTRGAAVADLAILVVAAEEGVKPQTEESIKILNETKTPYIVAINKIDKPNADIEKTKKSLADAGVLLEGYGGQVSFQAISAKTGEGINELLDLIILAADLENLTYNPELPASGFILESKLDRKRGIEATLIVKDGIIKSGEFIQTPSAAGKVKILENFAGRKIKEAEAGSPVLVIGFEKMPLVGEKFTTGELSLSEPMPQEIQVKEKAAIEVPRKEGAPSIKIILKASDHGSLEALKETIKSVIYEKSAVVLSESVGDIVDNDIKIATAGDTVILGFKTRVNKTTANIAEARNIKIITSDVIYELVKKVEELFIESEKQHYSGELEILAVFNQTKAEKQVVGGKVISGVFKNKANFEIWRNDEKVGEGHILNLQQQKKDTSSVSEGKEAGLLVNSQALIKVGDVLKII